MARYLERFTPEMESRMMFPALPGREELGAHPQFPDIREEMETRVLSIRPLPRTGLGEHPLYQDGGKELERRLHSTRSGIPRTLLGNLPSWGPRGATPASAFEKSSVENAFLALNVRPATDVERETVIVRGAAKWALTFFDPRRTYEEVDTEHGVIYIPEDEFWEKIRYAIGLVRYLADDANWHNPLNYETIFPNGEYDEWWYREGAFWYDGAAGEGEPWWPAYL